jgi:hypothetical protein
LGIANNKNEPNKRFVFKNRSLERTRAAPHPEHQLQGPAVQDAAVWHRGAQPPSLALC